MTVDGKNAAAVKSRHSRFFLFVAGILVLGIVSGLGYYAFSLMSLEKALAEASGIVFPVVISDMSEEPLILRQPEVPAVCPVSAEDLWRLYLAWQDKAVRIPLPASLAAAEGVSLKLDGIGMVREHLPPAWEELAVRAKGQGIIIEVLPLSPVAGTDMGVAYEIFVEAAPAQHLIVSIPDLQIVFPAEESSSLKLPCHADVLKIEFLIGSAIWCWTPDFRPEFLTFLEQGQVTVQNWMPVYQHSSDEERYREFLQIRIGSLLEEDLPGFPLADWIRKWNLFVLQYGELDQKLSLMRLKSKEAIRRFYPRAKVRYYNQAEWDLLTRKITALSQGISEIPGNELSAEVPGLLEEVMLMLYDYAFTIFYQETGAKADVTDKNDWKTKCQQLQLLLQNAAEIFSTGTDLKQALLQLQDTFLKLTPYSQQMLEYSQQAGKLKKKLEDLIVLKSPLVEKILDFEVKTHSTGFFRQYLENNREIPFQESQYQEFAALLNQSVSYRCIVTESKP